MKAALTSGRRMEGINHATVCGTKQSLVAVCHAAQRFRVANMRVFGSVLVGREKEGSDRTSSSSRCLQR